MTEVQLQGIRKDYGSFTAIANLNLSIKSGELVALLGPSGCGKTTTLRMIAGLETPTLGQIRFNSKDMADVSAQNRHVGLVFQHYALFPHMNVEQNVAFGLKMRGLPPQDISKRLNDMLEIVQLMPFRHRFPAQLSGGQMQRVAIARTLITRPSILMMDEPLANLDTKLRTNMRAFIKKLQQQLGITTIFVTHDQIEAMELSDRVAVIFDGELAQFDTPQTLYRKPNSLQLADFLGATNLIAAKINGKSRAQTCFGTLEYDQNLNLATKGSAHIMLRSETIDIWLEQPENHQNTFCGEIIQREFFGAYTRYKVQCAGEHVNVSEQSRRTIELGQKVWLSIAPRHIWVIEK